MRNPFVMERYPKIVSKWQPLNFVTFFHVKMMTGSARFSVECVHDGGSDLSMHEDGKRLSMMSWLPILVVFTRMMAHLLHLPLQKF